MLPRLQPFSSISGTACHSFCSSSRSVGISGGIHLPQPCQCVAPGFVGITIDVRFPKREPSRLLFQRWILRSHHHDPETYRRRKLCRRLYTKESAMLPLFEESSEDVKANWFPREKGINASRLRLPFYKAIMSEIFLDPTILLLSRWRTWAVPLLRCDYQLSVIFALTCSRIDADVRHAVQARQRV